jgi:hypothetical protein
LGQKGGQDGNGDKNKEPLKNYLAHYILSKNFSMFVLFSQLDLQIKALFI